jgi:hypothetical protein
MSEPESTCPSCGREAVDISEYRDGRVSYKHEIVEGPGGFPEVVDSCLVEPDDASS